MRHRGNTTIKLPLLPLSPAVVSAWSKTDPATPPSVILRARESRGGHPNRGMPFYIDWSGSHAKAASIGYCARCRHCKRAVGRCRSAGLDVDEGAGDGAHLHLDGLLCRRECRRRLGPRELYQRQSEAAAEFRSWVRAC